MAQVSVSQDLSADERIEWRTDGMYANFAGRDASRGMAKQSFEEGAHYLPFFHTLLTHTLTEMLTPIDQPLDKLEDLTQEEM